MMTKRCKGISAGMLPAMLLAAIPAPVSAQAQAQTADPDLLAVTCGEYLTAARIADPGKNPSKQRAAQALDAQDSMADAMLWVHGYLTGRASPSAQPVPLTKQWMVDHVGRLAKVCIDNSSDGKMRLVDAAMML